MAQPIKRNLSEQLAWLSQNRAAVVAFAPGSRIQLIILAQAMTVLVAPMLGVLLVMTANNKLLGDLRRLTL